jgi:hypothetical protein
VSSRSKYKVFQRPGEKTPDYVRQDADAPAAGSKSIEEETKSSTFQPSATGVYQYGKDS